MNVSNDFDCRPRRAAFPMAEAMCWNFMTPQQQDLLRINGAIQLGEYGGGPCPNRADVAVEVGDMPGPRFYCRACAEQASNNGRQ
jgi:hypothetical protein